MGASIIYCLKWRTCSKLITCNERFWFWGEKFILKSRSLHDYIGYGLDNEEIISYRIWTSCWFGLGDSSVNKSNFSSNKLRQLKNVAYLLLLNKQYFMKTVFVFLLFLSKPYESDNKEIIAKTLTYIPYTWELVWHRCIAVQEISYFPEHYIFFRQHKWITKLFFNYTTTKVLYLQLWIWFTFGAARLVEFRFVSVGDEMA